MDRYNRIEISPEFAMPKLNRDGVNIYYEVHGNGPPLLLTHGYSSTSAMWQGQIAALSKQHKLILWDMRGHGHRIIPPMPRPIVKH
jgi:pimeloyl-ACP methyl ester carboxylesterase